MLKTRFIVVLLVLSIVLPVLPGNAELTVDYTALRPLPSYRLETLAGERQGSRKNNLIITGLLGGTMFIAGLLADNAALANALEVAGLSNLLCAFTLRTYETPEEIAADRVQAMSTANADELFKKEKVAAEELLYAAQRSRDRVLEGPYGLTVAGTTVAGSYVFFSGYPVGALAFVGTYACFPQDTRTEDQAALLKKDIQAYLVTSPGD